MGIDIEKISFEAEDYHGFRVRLEENLSALKHLLEQPGFGQGKGEIAAKFEGAAAKAAGLKDAIQKVSEENNCYFFDAGTVTDTSRVDGVHLDEDQHLVLGKAMAETVKLLVSI